jgi:hypothetical protein
MDCFLECPLIEGAGTMDLKIPLLLQTRTAEVTFLLTPIFFGGVIREAATGTVRRLYRLDILFTSRTNDTTIFTSTDNSLADRAPRRKDKV